MKNVRSMAGGGGGARKKKKDFTAPSGRNPGGPGKENEGEKRANAGGTRNLRGTGPTTMEGTNWRGETEEGRRETKGSRERRKTPWSDAKELGQKENKEMGGRKKESLASRLTKKGKRKGEEEEGQNRTSTNEEKKKRRQDENQKGEVTPGGGG